MKAKDFSVQLEIFRPKRCGHTNRGQTLAATGRHEVSVGGRCRRMAGSAAYQRVDRPYSLLAQNEGSVTDQTEKAFVFRAETEISWSPFPTKAGAPVGTRLHRPLCNILKSHCNFKPLPTDRKPGSGSSTRSMRALWTAPHGSRQSPCGAGRSPATPLTEDAASKVFW